MCAFDVVVFKQPQCFPLLYSFDSFRRKILAAAQAVSDAKQKLMDSVQQVKATADRKAGWGKMVDACKVIAGKTVLLLQIVYGAEIERLFRSAEEAVEALEAVDA